MKKTILALSLALFATAWLSAQTAADGTKSAADTSKTSKPAAEPKMDTTVVTVVNGLIVPKEGLLPVRSFSHSEEVIDTVETGNDQVKVILYSDGSWQYWRDPAFADAQDREIFEKHWNNTSSNPYGKSVSDMPLVSAIWLVDSLSQFHSPYPGNTTPGSRFGIRRGRYHQGVDLPLQTGVPIYATFPGKVRISKVLGGYGNLVAIRHNNGLETFYGHLSERCVEEGQWVSAGDIIGKGGNTGHSTGPHLHFETRYQGFAFDPCWVVDFKTSTLRRRMLVLKKKYLNPACTAEQNFDDEAYNEEEDKKEAAAIEAMRWHTIKQGDTLSAIARKNGTTVSAICRLNGIKETTILQLGRKLRVR